jgi:hypothetical protein
MDSEKFKLLLLALHVVSTPSLVEFPKIERAWAGAA